MGPRGGQEIQDEIDRSAPEQAAPDMVRAWIATQPNAGDRRDQEKDPRRARDQGHGRREASRAPMQGQGRDGQEQGDASRQAKPAVPKFVHVNDEIMTEASQAPLPDDIPPEEYDWKVVHYKNKRRGRKQASPIPPSPPPARPDLRDTHT